MLMQRDILPLLKFEMILINRQPETGIMISEMTGHFINGINH